MSTLVQRHHWRTVSSHSTSVGKVRYQRCACGRWRVDLHTAMRVPALIAEVTIKP
jgi:hypothetical protein